MHTSADHGLSRRGGVAYAVFMALALAATAAQAQQAQPGTTTATTTASTASAETGLQEIVVTAEFRSEKEQQTPLAITALSGETLTERNVTNLANIEAPNVTMYGANAAYGKTIGASIRGLGQGDFNYASAEPAVGIYVDDVLFAGNFGAMFDMLDVDHVEVLRGPQGTLFGKNSIGGAIRVVSQQPKGDNTGFAEVTVGDYQRKEVRAGFDVGIIPDVLMLRVTGMSKDRNGYVSRLDYACAHPSTAGRLPENQLGQASCTLGLEGGVDVKGARAQLRWVPSDVVEDRLEASVIDDTSPAAAEVMVVADPALSGAMAGFNASTLIPKYGIPYDQRFQTGGTYTNYSTFYDPFLGTSYPAHNTVHEWSTSNVLTWAIAQQIQLKSVTAAQGYWGDFSDDQDNSPLGLAWAYNLLDHRQFTQEFDLTGKSFDKLDWVLGAYYFHGYSLNRGHIDLNFLAGFFPPGPPFNGQPVLGFNQNDPADTTDRAGFAQATYSLTDQLHATAGVRYTSEDKDYTFNHYNPLILIPNPALDLRGVEGRTSYSHIDWKAGLDYQMTPDVMTYVTATTGFRGGGLNPRPFTNTQVVPFAPEKLTEYEIGVKSEWFDHRLRANIDGYYGQYRDAVINSQRLDNAGNPLTAPVNVGSANITGFELQVDATPLPGLTVNLAAGLTDFKWENLGKNQGCQDFSLATQAAARAAGDCISGNPGYNDTNIGMSKWTANVGAQYAIPMGAAGSLTPRVDANYRSAYFNNYYNLYDPGGTGIAETPGMTLLNARVTWESMNQLWSVAFFGTNLTNKYYYQSFLDLRAFGEGQMSAQPAEPAEWGVTFRRNFCVDCSHAVPGVWRRRPLAGGARTNHDFADMKDVAGKVAFITGGASGMGLGMARVFSAAGMRIVIADVRQDHLDAAMRLFRGPNPGVHAIRVDVADRKAMAHAAVETEQVFGKVHVLCNNAGVGIIGSLLEASYDDWDWAMGVNLDAVFTGIHEFVPRIRSHGEGGHVVTTSSMGGLFAAGTAGIYNSSKYAVVCLMESLRPELAPHGIGVSAFCPGLVNTNIHEIERTRPAQYAHTGYTARAGELAAREEFMKTKILPAGMDPMEVGQRVLRGILRDELYILTHPEYEPGLRERFEAILASVPLEGPPPAARVAAEVVVLRNPLFAEERDRRLLQRAAARHGKTSHAGAEHARPRNKARTKPVKAKPVKAKPKRAGAARSVRARATSKRSRKR